MIGTGPDLPILTSHMQHVIDICVTTLCFAHCAHYTLPIEPSFVLAFECEQHCRPPSIEFVVCFEIFVTLAGCT